MSADVLPTQFSSPGKRFAGDEVNGPCRELAVGR